MRAKLLTFSNKYDTESITNASMKKRSLMDLRSHTGIIPVPYCMIDNRRRNGMDIVTVIRVLMSPV